MTKFRELLEDNICINTFSSEIIYLDNDYGIVFDYSDVDLNEYEYPMTSMAHVILESTSMVLFEECDYRQIRCIFDGTVIPMHVWEVEDDNEIH